MVVAGTLEATYVLLLLWPMRVWSRPVSPHTNLVLTFGLHRAGALRYVVTVGALFGLYGLALWLVLHRGARPRLAVALGAASLFYATLVLTHPLSSTDVFNYIAAARIQWAHGDNPLTTPPLAHPGDPFVRLVSNWRELPSPYGPLWSLLAGLPHALGGGRGVPTVVAFKATPAVFFLAAGALAGATAERLRVGAGPAAVVALTWNPLAVWHVAGNGHNDAVMVAFLALAAYLLARELPGPALLAIAASALVKFATLLLVPAAVVWWWRSRKDDGGKSPFILPLWLAGSLVLAVAAYAPYWQGLATVRGSLDEGTYFAVSGPAALRGALVQVMSVPAAEALAAWAARLGFLALYAMLLRRLWTHRAGADDLLATGALALVAYLLVAANYFAPWYVLWPLTLAVMVPWRREVLAPALALSLGAMSVLLWATWVRARFAGNLVADWYPMHLLSFLSIAPVTATAWWWARRAAGGSGAEPSTDVQPPVAERQVARARPEG